jgi:hypothetical protein
VGFFVLMGLGFELRASCLQSRYSTTWATTPVHFALVILEMGVSQTISLGWSQTMILLISASQVATITGVSHWHPASCLEICSRYVAQNSNSQSSCLSPQSS